MTVTRRQVLVAGAAVVTAPVWSTPIIGTVEAFASVSPHSAPPQRHAPPPETKTYAPELPMGPPLTPLPTGLTGTLPFTDGADYRVETAVGVAALAAGAAVVAKNRQGREPLT